MSRGPENLLLVYLRRIDATVGDLCGEMRDLKLRLTSLETMVGNLVATEMSHYAINIERVDRLADRVERIERRLDLRDAS